MHHPPLFSVHTTYLVAAGSTEILSDQSAGNPTLLETFCSRHERLAFLRGIVEDATGQANPHLSELQLVGLIQSLLGPMTITLYSSRWDEARQMYRTSTPATDDADLVPAGSLWAGSRRPD